MKVLITGGNGFVGKHLTKKLLLKGCEVVITSRKKSSEKKLDDSNLLKTLTVNYLEIDSLFSVFVNEQPDYIVHLASGKDRRSLEKIPTTDLLYEMQINFNIIQAASNMKNLKKFVFIGSSDQYDMSAFASNFPNIYSPCNAYGFLKSTASLLLDTLFRESNFPIVQLVPTIIYGPGQGEEMFLPALINTLKEGREIEMTKGEQYRDFIYIDDLVNAISVSLFDLDEQFLGKTYAICSGTPVKLVDLVRLVVKLTNTDIAHVQIGKKDYRVGERLEFDCNYNLFNEDSGWKPKTTLEYGILRMTRSK